MLGEDTQTLLFRGRRSRNKVSVGEPAEGSLSFLHRTVRIVLFVREAVCSRLRTLSLVHPAPADLFESLFVCKGVSPPAFRVFSEARVSHS